MPVVSASGARGWGYDGVDLFAVHAAYGGPDGLKAFVDSCHREGIGVIVDVVYNHLGPVGNHLAEFGPYFTDRHQTPWGDAVNFDSDGAAEVRQFVIDNACMWLRDFHADGLRLDAVHAIVDESPSHVLAELVAAVRALEVELGRPFTVIAESDANDPRIVTPHPDGYGLDAVWSDDWHHALHTMLTGERDGYYEDYGSFDDLIKALRQAWVYDGRPSRYLGRLRGGSPAGLPHDRFVICTQNHDQIGNRARGERLGMLTSPGRVKIAAALLLTSPFVPMLFQGEEWAAGTPFLYFTDHADPDLAAAVREGRRAEFATFGWRPEDVPDPQAPASFTASVLDWSEHAAQFPAEILDWYRQLLALRRAERDLHDAAVAGRARVDDGVLRYERGAITVLANLAAGERTEVIGAGADLLMAGNGTVVADEKVTLPADGVVIVRVMTKEEQGG
jgi:maltooligosyltrehalose trehalohydrolase